MQWWWEKEIVFQEQPLQPTVRLILDPPVACITHASLIFFPHLSSFPDRSEEKQAPNPSDSCCIHQTSIFLSASSPRKPPHLFIISMFCIVSFLLLFILVLATSDPSHRLFGTKCSSASFHSYTLGFIPSCAATTTSSSFSFSLSARHRPLNFLHHRWLFSLFFLHFPHSGSIHHHHNHLHHVTSYSPWHSIFLVFSHPVPIKCIILKNPAPQTSYSNHQMEKWI